MHVDKYKSINICILWEVMWNQLNCDSPANMVSMVNMVNNTVSTQKAKHATNKGWSNAVFKLTKEVFSPRGEKIVLSQMSQQARKARFFLSRDFSVWSSHCLSHCERSFCQNCQFRRQCQSGSGKSDKKKSSRWKRNCCFYFYEMIDSMTDGQNLCGGTALSILSNSRFHLM